MFSGTSSSLDRLVSHKEIMSYLWIELCASSRETRDKSSLLEVFRFQLQKEKYGDAPSLAVVNGGPGFSETKITQVENTIEWRTGLTRTGMH